MQEPVRWITKQAWARSLKRVSKLEIGEIGARVQNHWYPIDDVKLIFDNGEVLIVPGQQSAGAQPDARRRSDEFIKAVTAGISF